MSTQTPHYVKISIKKNGYIPSSEFHLNLLRYNIVVVENIDPSVIQVSHICFACLPFLLTLTTTISFFEFIWYSQF